MSASDGPDLYAELVDVVALGTPRRFVRLVDCFASPDGSHAAALVVLNPDSTPYPMVSLCSRTDEGWVEDDLTELDRPACAQVREVWCCVVGERAVPGANVWVQYAGMPPRTAHLTASGWVFDVAWFSRRPTESPRVVSDR